VRRTLPQIRELAIGWHHNTRYGIIEPYINHLDEVYGVLREFEWIIPHDEPYADWFTQAAYIHDVFEDTKITPGQVLAAGFDHGPVCLALLVTDQPGATRAIRKVLTYPIIATDWCAVVLKLADRIANVRRKGKIEMYRKEQPEFEQALRGKGLGDSGPIIINAVEAMWNTLDSLLHNTNLTH
jgi:(p)ppGpp synthase/HD superfamily hydrolase